MEEVYESSRTSIAQTPLGLWKFVPDRGGLSYGVFIIEPGQEA